MSEIEQIPTRVLEMELQRRRADTSGVVRVIPDKTDSRPKVTEVTEADLERAGALAFGREPHMADNNPTSTGSGDEVSEADLDQMSAAIHGRQVKS